MVEITDDWSRCSARGILGCSMLLVFLHCFSLSSPVSPFPIASFVLMFLGPKPVEKSPGNTPVALSR